MLLGLFVFWQFLFIVIVSFLQTFAPDAAAGPSARVEPDEAPPAILGKDHLEDALGLASGVFRRWGEATGQGQGWRQFTPRAPRQAVFPAIEARWDDNRVEHWRTRVEPEDMRAFYRFFYQKRHATYEQAINICDWDSAEIARDPEAWRQHLTERLRVIQRPLRAYLEWRLIAWQRAHPDQPPPTELILVARQYGIPPPGQADWMWTGPEEVRLARWAPHVTPPDACLPLEYFDPQTGQFHWLKKAK